MKHSPLQLVRYLAPEIAMSANSAFNPAKPIEAGTDQLAVQAVVAQQKAPDNFQGRSWVIEMSITQTIKEGQNFPYTFKLALVGLFLCHDGKLANEIEERFVRTNGSSILYATARELVRSLTTLGPWGQVLLPTASFYENVTEEKEEAAAPKSG